MLLTVFAIIAIGVYALLFLIGLIVASKPSGNFISLVIMIAYTWAIYYLAVTYG